MKSNTLRFFTAISLLTVLALPISLAAQERATNFRHYKLIDIGTFGGPASFINSVVNSFPALNSHGTTVGNSATPTPSTSISSGFVCGGPNGLVPNVSHAFELQNGAVTDLSSLPPADQNCSDAGSVNARGEIAGTSEIDELDPVIGIKEVRAVVWKQGEIINLGTLGGAWSGSGGPSGAINNRGQVVGFAQNAVPDPVSLIDFQIGGSSNGTETRAFVWQRGQMRDLGTLGGPDAFAVFVNERGQIAGFSYTDSVVNPATAVPTTHPFLWENGRMTDLGTLGGTLAGSAFLNFLNGLNNRGQVIGMSTLPGDPGCLNPVTGCLADVFLWSEGKMTDISTSTIGGNPFLAFAINDAGEIVGAADFSSTGGPPFDAFVWRDGVATDLGQLGDCASLAFAINSRSQVVGGTFSCAHGNLSHSRAFLWENGTIVDLNALVPAGSSLQLVEPEAINDRGEIAGNGVPLGVAPGDINALAHAFLLIPVCEDGTEGCADAPLDPAVVARSRAESVSVPKTMTAEEMATFKETVIRIASRDRGFGLWRKK
jgi:probable HAF family extracellular repeat protein